LNTGRRFDFWRARKKELGKRRVGEEGPKSSNQYEIN
jgi:hypothetical protein